MITDAFTSAGSYTYPEVPNDVYRRHSNCRCTVEYEPGKSKLRQNVWTKQWTDMGEPPKRVTIPETHSGKNPLTILQSTDGRLADGGGQRHILLGTIDPTDTQLANQVKDLFCEQYASSPVENMLAITQDGEVHFVTSNKLALLDTDCIWDKLKGSYNIHTHPPAATQYSFSISPDIEVAFSDGTAVMEAVDYKYRYRFIVLKDITFEQFDKVRGEVKADLMEILDSYGMDFDSYEENQLHVLIAETCKRLNLEVYSRWLR